MCLLSDALDEGMRGGSTGTAVAAALKYAEDVGKVENIVVMAADTGRNYLSKIFNDQWMKDNGVWEGWVVSGEM